MSIAGASDRGVYVPIEWVGVLGSHMRAFFLAQVCYLINRLDSDEIDCIDGDRWLNRSDPEWSADGFSKPQALRARQWLTQHGYLETRPSSDGRRELVRPSAEVRKSPRFRIDRVAGRDENEANSPRSRTDVATKSKRPQSYKRDEELGDTSSLPRATNSPPSEILSDRRRSQIGTKVAYTLAQRDLKRRESELGPVGHKDRWLETVTAERIKRHPALHLITDCDYPDEQAEIERLANMIEPPHTPQPRTRGEREAARIEKYFEETKGMPKDLSIGEASRWLNGDQATRDEILRNHKIPCPDCIDSRTGKSVGRLFAKPDGNGTIPLCPTCKGDRVVAAATSQPNNPDAELIEQLAAVINDPASSEGEKANARQHLEKRRRAGSRAS